MFAQFSRGYYMGRLYVEPAVEKQAAMCQAQHEQLNKQLYSDGTGLERLDAPLVMKLGSTHLAVHGDESVPADTLAVPESILDDRTVRDLPTLQEVFLAKADRAAQLLPYTDAGSAQPTQTELN